MHIHVYVYTVCMIHIYMHIHVYVYTVCMIHIYMHIHVYIYTVCMIHIYMHIHYMYIQVRWAAAAQPETEINATSATAPQSPGTPHIIICTCHIIICTCHNKRLLRNRSSTARYTTVKYRAHTYTKPNMYVHIRIRF